MSIIYHANIFTERILYWNNIRPLKKDWSVSEWNQNKIIMFIINNFNKELKQEI